MLQKIANSCILAEDAHECSVLALLAPHAALGDNIIIDSERNYVGIRCATGWLILHLSVESLLPWGGQNLPQHKLSVRESKDSSCFFLEFFAVSN